MPPPREDRHAHRAALGRATSSREEWPRWLCLCSELVPRATAARVEFPSLHNGQAGPQQARRGDGTNHHLSHKQRDEAQLLWGREAAAAASTDPVLQPQRGPGLSAACHVFCPGEMSTLFKRKRRRERKSCSIVLLQVEKG